jgi:hypothetical protein
MKVSEILREDAAAGCTSAGAVGGFRGSLFGGSPVTRPKKRYKVRTLKFKGKR